MLVRILNTLRSRIWDMVWFLFSDYPKSTVGENGDDPEKYGFSGNQIPRNWHLYKEFYLFCWQLLLFSYGQTVLWLKIIIFWTIPSSSNSNTNFLLEPKSRKAEIWYRRKCDVGASKNASQAFSTKRLSSHFLLYQISAFRFFFRLYEIYKLLFK